MAGDLQGVTHLTGLSVTSGPGGSQATYAVPVIHAAGGTQVLLDSGSSLVAASGSSVAVLAGAQVSWHTIAAHSSLASVAGTGLHLGLIFRASGLSLLARSQNTVYYFNSDASGAA
jgi:hypothetical protein